jgi:tetratricopeptide (TPR) repeat protein
MTLSQQSTPVSSVSQTKLFSQALGPELAKRLLGPRLEWVAVLFVALFASLLASFPARNNDLWMHMATGRQLVQSVPSLGRTPETALSAGWLYDLVSYALYQTFGGPGLVLIKAALVAALACFLLSLSRSESGWWLPTLCTSLALLAMSTRFLLQPAVVSYFFLALMLWLVERRQEKDTQATRRPTRAGLLPAWPLVLLFVIWANTDSGFIIGLGTLALLEAGRVLDRTQAGASKIEAQQGETPGSLWLHFVVSLGALTLACLVNPVHVHAFRMALQQQGFEGAGFTSGQILSPFQKAYWTNTTLSPAALAYYPLLALGLASFALDARGWRWRRFLPWLALALFSAVRIKAVPFFALVGGPVLAWNLHDFFARHADSERQEAPLWGRTLLGLRAVAVTLGLLFLTSAWPGWLQAPPFEPRRWDVLPSPSLEVGADAMRTWHEQGRLGPEARALHLSADSLSVFAWFCPEEQGVLDPGLTASLLGEADAADDWDGRMRSAGINHVVVYDTRRTRLLAALSQLLADPEHWLLLHLEGDLAVFGWRDPVRPGGPDPFAGQELDLTHLAFHPERAKTAPASVNERQMEATAWQDAFWKPAPAGPIDREEATLYLLQAETLRRSAPVRHMVAWDSTQTAGLLGVCAGWSGPGLATGGAGTGPLTDGQLRLLLLRPPLPQPGSTEPLSPISGLIVEWQGEFARQRPDTSPGALYLAIRAARRALAVNARDAQAYLVLGESYLGLLHDTRERVWAERFADFLRLRRVQASAALNQALAIKPELAQAHLHLGWLYREMGYLDLALDHLRRHLRLARQAGPEPGLASDQAAQQMHFYEREVQQLAAEVEQGDLAYEAGWARLKVVDRATLALTNGLAGKALDLLLKTDVALFGPPGMRMELELLLRTGRLQDVLDWTGPDQEAVLGANSYHTLRSFAYAASGDYSRGRQEWARANPRRGPRLRQALVVLVGQSILDQCPAWPSLPWSLGQAYPKMQFSATLAGLIRNMREEASAAVLAGLLALEQGDVDEAEVAFRLALETWSADMAASPSRGLDFDGRLAAQECVGWLK